jgi:ubiquilin
MACQEASAGMSADEMRLIFKGKILKDEITLDEYKIENGMTVHLVKGKGASSTGTTSGSSTTTTTNVSGGDTSGTATNT